MKNKERVYHAIRHLTDRLNGHLDHGLTAQDIAEHVGLQRNVVSHFANELSAEGKVIKLNTRPVYFLDREMFQNHGQNYPLAGAFLQSEGGLMTVAPAIGSDIPGGREGEVIETSKVDPSPESLDGHDLFSRLVGSEGSLRYVVEQCKAAVHYPPNGLPLLLVGSSGVGKSHIAQLIFDYGRQKGVVGQEAPFVVFNCAEYAHNPELLSAALFGHCKGAFTGAEKDKTGLLEEADGGYLFLDEIHRLSPEGQEKLFLFLDKGVFRKVGESGKWRNATVRMVYATTENPENNFLQTFLRRIPLVVKIPTFQERPLSEKLDLIQMLYGQESQRIARRITVSNQVVNLLLKSRVDGNIGKLTNAIKISCASAFNQSTGHDGEVRVRIRHLPPEYMSQHDGMIFESIGFEDMQLTPDGLPCKAHIEKTERFGERSIGELLDIFEAYVDLTLDLQQFLSKGMGVVNQFVDHIMFRDDVKPPATVVRLSVEKVVESILGLAELQYGVRKYGNSTEVIAMILTGFMDVHGTRTCADSLSESMVERLQEMVETVSLTLSKEWRMAKRLIEAVEMNLDVNVDPMAGLYLMLYMRSLNRQTDNDLTHGVIIAHGYTTASSIAGVANRMLGQYVFEAFDMPLEMSATEIGSKMNSFIESIDTSKGLVILVDMGSLEGIYKGIQSEFFGDIALFNNVSTQLALDVGSRIIQKQSVEQIAKEVLTSTVNRYDYKPAERTRQNAILTTCSTGIGTASKIKDLLERCFSDEGIAVVAYDYDRLKGNGKDDYVFKQYQVKLIIGTNDPQIPEVPYVSLENLIVQRDGGVLETVLQPMVEQRTLQTLEREIIRLFTLENVLNHLTILNPDKIIDQVEKALSQMEAGLDVKLESSHKISLTIHICCMIERLVIKDPIVGYARFDEFEKKHPQFVRLARSAFGVIEKFYRVEMPISEIGFIYENLKYRIADMQM